MVTVLSCVVCVYFFFFNDTATTEIYTDCHTLSLHDALPICCWTPRTISGPPTMPLERCLPALKLMSVGRRHNGHLRKRRAQDHRASMLLHQRRQQIGRAHV